MNKNYTFRCPNELREKLEEKADKEGRSIANVVIYILREYFKDR